MLTGAVPYSQFSALPIYAPVRLGCDGSDENMLLYLADAEIARQAVNAYNILFGLGLGVTGLMGLYALSLFWHKRSETYLAWFAAYAGMLTLWSLGSLLSAYAPGAAAFLSPATPTAGARCSTCFCVFGCLAFPCPAGSPPGRPPWEFWRCGARSSG